MKTDEQIKKIFDEYVNLYDMENNMINLKYEHTFRVAKNAREIAINLNLSKTEIYVAYIIGILHDIGRFYQVTNYNTFSDFEIKNFDHGDLGEEILKSGELNKYLDTSSLKKYFNIICLSVKYHNKFKLNEINEYLLLPEKEKMFIKVIRDADKLDILNIVSDKKINLENDFNYSNFDMSDKVYDTLINHDLVLYSDVSNKLDAIATHLGYIFDINFLYTFEKILEKKYITTYINNYKYNDVMKEKMKNIENVILKYIRNNIKQNKSNNKKQITVNCKKDDNKKSIV